MTMAKEINDENIKEVVDNFSTIMKDIENEFVNSGKDEESYNEKIGKFNYLNVVFEIRIGFIMKNNEGKITHGNVNIYAIPNERAKIDFQKLTKYSYSVNYPSIESNDFSLDYFASETIGRTINDMKKSIDKFIDDMKKEIASYTEKINQLNDIMKIYH